MNMCEIKFYNTEFSVSKEYYQKLLYRQEILLQKVSKKYVVHNTLITTFGLVKNEYSDIFHNAIFLDSLFAE